MKKAVPMGTVKLSSSLMGKASISVAITEPIRTRVKVISKEVRVNRQPAKNAVEKNAIEPSKVFCFILSLPYFLPIILAEASPIIVDTKQKIAIALSNKRTVKSADIKK